MQSEVACLTEVYPEAVPCLLQAKEVASTHYLDYLGATADLHLAHVQFQMGMAPKAAKFLKRCMPAVLAHGGLYEASRAKALAAKIMVAASSSSGTTQKARTDVFQAIGECGWIFFRSNQTCKIVILYSSNFQPWY